MAKKIRLKVVVSEADGLGQAGKPGDVVEVEDDVAERYVAAGLAEDAGSAPASSSQRAVPRAAPAEEKDEDEEDDKPAGPTGRRR